MVCPNVLVLLALAIGARVQLIDAQSVYLDAVDLPAAVDYVTYYAEDVNTLTVGTFWQPLCSPYKKGSFVERKRQSLILANGAPIFQSNGDSSPLWKFTAFPALTPWPSDLYRSYASSAQSRRTYAIHLLDDVPTPLTPVPTTTSMKYIVPISSGMPQNTEGSGAWIWILILPFIAVVVRESRQCMDSPPPHTGMETYLLVAMLLAHLPHHVYGQPCTNETLAVSLFSNLGVGVKAFFASGQETGILQTGQSLPYCTVFARSCDPPLITMENNDTDVTERRLLFSSQVGMFRLTWNSTATPHLKPFHTGTLLCRAGGETAKRMYDLSVVVPSNISCQQPHNLSERVFSVSCTVCGYPKPTIQWEGQHIVNTFSSELSFQYGVLSYNSTALFQLPDNLADDTSISVSLEVFHNPPVNCTVVTNDVSVQERCNNASMAITRCFVISCGNRTIENDTCADDVLTSGPITTRAPSPGPTSHGMSQSTTNLQGNTDTVVAVVVAVVGSIVLIGIIVIVIGIVLCLVKSKNNRNEAPDTEPLPQASPKSKQDTCVHNDDRPPQVTDPSADPVHYDTFVRPDQQGPGTAPSARPDTYAHIVLHKSIPAEGETYDHLDREQIQAIKQGQQPGQQSAAATALSTQQAANPRVDTSYSMVDMSKKTSKSTPV